MILFPETVLILITMLFVQTREAQERMNEMRQLIGKRLDGEIAPSRSNELPGSPVPYTTDASRLQGLSRSLQDLISGADKDLARATTNHETLRDGLKALMTEMAEVCQIKRTM